jgi:hypothetical protein
MFERESALRFHEPDEVLHAGVPGSRLRFSISVPDPGSDEHGRDDEHDKQADDRPA